MVLVQKFFLSILIHDFWYILMPKFMFMCGLNLVQCPDGEIRLQDGTSTFGRVEVCDNHRWGTVCDVGWDTVDAQVACSQLGHIPFGASALTGLDVPDGTGPIWLASVNCNGGETALHDCDAETSLAIQNCTHSEDAGVACGE